MKNSAIRMFGVGTCALLLTSSLTAFERQQLQIPARDKTVMAPRDARQLRNRADLTNLFRQQPTINVIVGLRTASEPGLLVAAGDDRTRQIAVEAEQTRVLDRLQGLNVSRITRFRFHSYVAMTVDATALGALLADPDVASVSEDGLVFPLLSDSVSMTRATNAWGEGFRGNGQTVAVIDSGVDPEHPFFAGKVVAEACFSNPDPGATSLCPGGQVQQIGPGAGVACPNLNIGCWHGTHVAGIAVGNYGLISPTAGGVAPGANVISIQVFQKECSTGTCQLVSSYSDIMLALEHVYSLRNAFSIAAANMSLGGLNFTATCDNEAPGVTAVIQSLRAADIATVVSSGNAASSNAISFPGCVSHAISVGSVNKEFQVAAYSNSADFLSLLAPGTSISSSVPGGSYGVTSGTSMAAPHVAGAWATLKSAKPAATVAEVLSALEAGGVPMTDPRNVVTKSVIRIGDNGSELGALGLLLGRDAQADNEIIIDNAAAGVSDAAGGRTFTGSWCEATLMNQFGSSALVNCPGAAATYRWTPTIPTTGVWDVHIWWNAQAAQSSKAPVKVVSADGSVNKTFDERSGGGQWVLHGRYNFDAGATGYVQTSAGGSSQVSADAVRFTFVPGAAIMPVVTLSVPDPSANETGPAPGLFSVSRTGSLATAVTVEYTVNGTATPGADYTPLSGTVTIPAGSSSASIVVMPADDAIVEGIETVQVTLAAGSGYTLGSSTSANVKITSDDASGGPTLAATAVTGKVQPRGMRIRRQ